MGKPVTPVVFLLASPYQITRSQDALRTSVEDVWRIPAPRLGLTEKELFSGRMRNMPNGETANFHVHMRRGLVTD